MSETRVFADGYRGVFQNQEDFLKCLNSIGRNSFWERKISKNLRLVAITSGSKVEEELRQMSADEGLDGDIIADTIINTGLILKIRNQYYPVRNCAIKSILDRAEIVREMGLSVKTLTWDMDNDGDWAKHVKGVDDYLYDLEQKKSNS